MAVSPLIREIVALHRAQLAGIIEVRGVGRLRGIYASSRTELEDRLASLKRDGKGQTFAAVHLQLVLAQVVEALRNFEAPFREHLHQTGQLAGVVAPRQVAQMIGRVETARGAMTPVIAAEQAAVVRGVYPSVAPTLLQRYRDSAKRYGPQALLSIRDGLSRSLVQGETVDQAVDRLVKAGGTFDGQRWRAERVCRTELSHAAGVTTQRAMEGFRMSMPKLLKRWVETRDDREGDDSKDLDGQTVPVDQPFVWVVKDSKGRPTGKIVRMMQGPNRPNDRSLCIPWQSAWGNPETVAPAGPVKPTTRGLASS